jgi:hypothetical protein
MQTQPVMNSQALAQSRWWTGLNIVLILYAAVIVLFPPVRQVHAFTWPFLFGLGPVYVIVELRRLKADGTGNIPMGELYRQVKAGRRLRTSALETAASVAFVLALMNLH